ncbi:MAG: 3-ketoacyl-ACP reductase [Marinilabiliales bacterium]|nr:MAG: 3-ketoacyl-ACP reductase [Marinilabiliales bacterium]
MAKTALVTGGTRGIGLAIANGLADKGYDVAVNGVRDEDLVAGILDKIRAIGVRVLYCRGDVGTPEGRMSVVDKLKREFGAVNLLVNNAGVAPLDRMDALTVTEESYERVMRINLKGPFFLTRDVAGMMVEKRGTDSSFSGMVINIGSISATVVSPNRAEYCISKAGFAMHSSIWAARLAEYGIPVYEVRPGVIRTDMTSGVTGKYDKLIGEGLNIQPRWGTPEDVALAVVSLAEGNFPFSSGGVFMVDGGLTVCRL